MPATTNRDLAESDLWELSLERSRRRRILAANARKEQNRRRTASVAVSAAVVAAPVWPSVAGSGGFEARAEAASGPKYPGGHERVLLSFGDTSPAVAAVQRELRIIDDGIFGPITRAAVRSFQKRSGLRATGEVDVRTWLALFPGDSVIAQSSADAGPDVQPQWAAVTAAPSAGSTVPAVAEAGGTPGGAPGVKPRPRLAAKKARAAQMPGIELPTWEGPPADSPADGGADPSAPPAEGRPAPPVTGAPPASGPNAPSATPRPVAPVPPRPVVPAPRGSVGEMINAMIREANRIDRARYPYRWGGGHNPRFTGPYDCSGAVSAVLHAAGLLRSPMVSGGFTRWGARGRGLVTIYANASHVYMSIRGRFFGTSRANPGGGAGWFRGAPRAGFTVVHVPFERMRLNGRKLAMKPVKRVPRQRAYIRAPRRATGASPTADRLTGGTPARAYVPPATAPQGVPTAPAPVQNAAPVPAPSAPAPTQPSGTQVPQAPAQPKPVSVTTPAGSVTLTPPQGPSAGGADGTAGTAPAAPGAPAQPQPAPAPSAPAPAAGSTGEGAAQPQPEAPAPPVKAVGEAAESAVDGTAKAVGTVTSTVGVRAPEAPPAPDSEPGAPGTG